MKPYIHHGEACVKASQAERAAPQDAEGLSDAPPPQSGDGSERRVGRCCVFTMVNIGLSPW